MPVCLQCLFCCFIILKGLFFSYSACKGFSSESAKTCPPGHFSLAISALGQLAARAHSRSPWFQVEKQLTELKDSSASLAKRRAKEVIRPLV